MHRRNRISVYMLALLAPALSSATTAHASSYGNGYTNSSSANSVELASFAYGGGCGVECGGGGGSTGLSDASAGPSCGGSSSYGNSGGSSYSFGGGSSAYYGNSGSSGYYSNAGSSGYYSNSSYQPSAFGNSYQPSAFGNSYQPSAFGNSYQPSAFGNSYQPSAFDSGYGGGSSYSYGSGDSSYYGNGVGDPINSATGNKYAVQRDYVGAGPFPLRFVRTYNSLNQVPDVATTELGVGWRGFYDRSIALLANQSSPTARVVRPDGKTFLFTFTNGVWTSDPDVTARLASTNDASGNPIGWTYTGSNDSVETYDANGRLLTIANRAGLTQTLAYDASGNLATVTDPFGRQLAFGYNGNNQLIRMVDPAGGVYAYGYDGNGNLTSVTYPDGTTRSYLYEDAAFPNALTGLIDENGVRFATWTYDEQGRAVSSTLAGGAQNVTLSYNGDGTTSVTDARGATRTRAFVTPFGAPESAGMTVTCPGCTAMTSSVTYDANGFVSSRTDFNGNTTLYTYNDRGLLVSRTDAAGTPQARTVTLTWHPVFRRPTEIRFLDRVIDFTYDAHGNLLTKTITDGTDTRTWRYQYNDLGLLAEIDGPRTDVAQVTRFAYDAQGNLASVTNALNQVWHITARDPNGRPLSITDPNGVVTQFAYDARGRRVRRTRAGRTTTYAYDAAGELSKITLPNGMTRTLSHDAAHRLIAVTDTVGDRLQFTLDAAGDRVKRELRDPSGNVIRGLSNTFNPLGQLIARTDANGHVTQFSYDNDGNRLSATDPLGHTVSTAYDALNRRVSITDPAGGVTQLSYDLHNHLTQALAPNGATTQYSYDGLGDLLSETSPDRGNLTLTYNSAGEVATKTDARGITATYRYDALNRLTAIHYLTSSAGTAAWHWLTDRDSDKHPSADVRFTYDTGSACTFGIGRLCAVHDESGATRYSYDAFGNVTRQAETTDGLSDITGYAYDSINQLTAVTYPDGRTVNYGRDALDRIDAIDATVNGKRASILNNLTYRPDGLPLTQTFGNGLTDTRLYDPVGRLVNQFIGSADTRVYSYDATGNLVMRQTLPQVDNYAYDALSRLIEQQRTAAKSTTTDFGYDANGNRLSVTRGSATIPYDYVPISNRLVQVGSDTLALDAAGNTIADHHGERTFTYDPAGRLNTVSDDHRPIATYRYNAFGERTEKRTAEGTTLYHYDVTGRLLSETDAQGIVRRDYVWRDMLPAVQIDRAGQGSIQEVSLDRDNTGQDDGQHGLDRLTYLHTDASGTPRLATDVRGTVVWRWDGGAFGDSAPTGGRVVTDHGDGNADHEGDGENAISRPIVTINLRFPGQYYDRETGFFYNWARYYDPGTGRFVSSDPIGIAGGLNTYAYVLENPLAWTDPLGLANLCLGPACSGNLIGPPGSGSIGPNWLQFPPSPAMPNGSPSGPGMTYTYPGSPENNPLSPPILQPCFPNCGGNLPPPGIPPLPPDDPILSPKPIGGPSCS